MNDEIWIVIPTYWGSPEAGIYDHPTPLDGESTLPTLLDSLAVQDFQQKFNVLVLVSTTGEDFNQAATSRVQEIIETYSSRIDLAIANVLTARKLDAYLKGFGLDLCIREMRGYAAVRNMQLLVPAALGAEMIIALDDDELVEADYLKRATQYSGTRKNWEKLVALAGPYLNDFGDPYLQEPIDQTNLLLDKAILMNQTMKQMCEDPSTLSISPIAFGGNMVFHRDVFSRVGFDPGITRGEDIDYLINARIADFDFYFDPRLTILHRPPRHYEAPQYAKLRQDVIRFQYERHKISTFGISPESLMPYPGAFLTDDFPEIALDALRLVASPELEEKFGTPSVIIQESERDIAKKLRRYQQFLLDWPKAIAQVSAKSLVGYIDILS